MTATVSCNECRKEIYSSGSTSSYHEVITRYWDERRMKTFGSPRTFHFCEPCFEKSSNHWIED